jgi:hypothetical protein
MVFQNPPQKNLISAPKRTFFKYLKNLFQTLYFGTPFSQTLEQNYVGTEQDAGLRPAKFVGAFF